VTAIGELSHPDWRDRYSMFLGLDLAGNSDDQVLTLLSADVLAGLVARNAAALSISPTNNGWGLSGLDLNSG
jgi:hypothetical protein